QLDQARSVLQEVVRADSANAAAPAQPGTRRPQQPADVGWSRARFHLAELDVISGRYDEARTTFAALAEEAPEDGLANECLDRPLRLNEMGASDAPALKSYGASRQARLLHDRNGIKTALESIVRGQPDSPLAPVALFEWAAELDDEHDTTAALARYDEVVAKY